MEARQGVLHGLVALSGGGTTPMVVGGDLNFGLVGLRAGLQEAGLPAQKTFIAKSRENNFKHGDLAVALGGLVAMQENSEMGGILRRPQRRSRRGSRSPGARGQRCALADGVECHRWTAWPGVAVAASCGMEWGVECKRFTARPGSPVEVGRVGARQRCTAWPGATGGAAGAAGSGQAGAAAAAAR